jgi:hypothetical protein
LVASLEDFLILQAHFRIACYLVSFFLWGEKFLFLAFYCSVLNIIVGSSCQLGVSVVDLDPDWIRIQWGGQK